MDLFWSTRRAVMVHVFYRFFLGKELLYAFVHVFYRFFLAKELLYAFVLRVHYRNAAALAGSSQTSILDVAIAVHNCSARPLGPADFRTTVLRVSPITGCGTDRAAGSRCSRPHTTNNHQQQQGGVHLLSGQHRPARWCVPALLPCLPPSHCVASGPHPISL